MDVAPRILIPARWDSSRFPGKPLALIAGVPLITRVARRASEAFGLECVTVVTDDPRIADEVQRNGFDVAFSKGAHATGTDRNRCGQSHSSPLPSRQRRFRSRPAQSPVPAD